MHLSADISSALQQIEAVKLGIEESDDVKLQMSTADSLVTILDVLQDPVFRTICHVQDSLSELNAQLVQHPSMLPNDFDIDIAGNLVFTVHGDVVYEFDERLSSTQMSPRPPDSPVISAIGGKTYATGGGNNVETNNSNEESSLVSVYNKKLLANSASSGVGGGGSSSVDVEEMLCSQSQAMKSSSLDLLSSDYAQIQAIELVNDGTGLGFGIIGARSSGVIVKTILSDGVADRDGRLRSGDHILQIGEVNLHDMVSEQVASVLRQSGTHVRLVVARAIDFASSKYELEPGSAIVPSRVLVDPVELERYLISTGYPEIFGESSSASTPQNTTEDERFVYRGNIGELSSLDIAKRPPVAPPPPLNLDGLLELPETEKLQVELKKDINGLGITIAGYVCEKEELSGIFVKSVSPGSAADMSGRIRVNDRIIEVDGQSLQGFSNHQAVELLKKSGQVVNLRMERYLRGPKYEQLQQAIAANDKVSPCLPSTPLRALPPHMVATVTAAPVTPQRNTSIAAIAKVVPFTMATKDDDLEAMTNDGNTLLAATLPAASTSVSASSSAAAGAAASAVIVEHVMITDGVKMATAAPAAALSSFETESNKMVSSCDATNDGIHHTNVADISSLTVTRKSPDNDNDILEIEVSQHHGKPQQSPRHKYDIEQQLSAELEEEIIRKWKKVVGADVDVVVAQIKKFAVGGLGISLEGTVDVEGGREVRPHHYIRSILSDGPVGVNGILRSGDELLEVNGERLLGMNHLEVVAILKELPQDVRMVCGRGKMRLMSFSDDTLKKLSSNFENLLPTSDRLVKAKSDGSLATVTSANDVSFSKLKSRSLEPLTGLAMWSSEPQIIELIKGDRGLGFSILDYQDPLDPNDTLIVIRSLVPGGVAQLDGRLIPGDRLLFVNSINLENASLDQAVQALKGAPKGVVRIGVAKPLPMTDTSIKSNGNGTASSEGGEDASIGGASGSMVDNVSGHHRKISTLTIEPDLIPAWRK